LAVTGEAEGKETIVEDRRGLGTEAGSDATDDAEKGDEEAHQEYLSE